MGPSLPAWGLRRSAPLFVTPCMVRSPVTAAARRLPGALDLKLSVGNRPCQKSAAQMVVAPGHAGVDRRCIQRGVDLRRSRVPGIKNTLPLIANSRARSTPSGASPRTGPWVRASILYSSAETRGRQSHCCHQCRQFPFRPLLSVKPLGHNLVVLPAPHHCLSTDTVAAKSSIVHWKT